MTAKRYEVSFGSKIHEEMEKAAALLGVSLDEFTKQALEFYIHYCNERLAPKPSDQIH